MLGDRSTSRTRIRVDAIGGGPSDPRHHRDRIAVARVGRPSGVSGASGHSRTSSVGSVRFRRTVTAKAGHSREITVARRVSESHRAAAGLPHASASRAGRCSVDRSSLLSVSAARGRVRRDEAVTRSRERASQKFKRRIEMVSPPAMVILGASASSSLRQNATRGASIRVVEEAREEERGSWRRSAATAKLSPRREAGRGLPSA